MFIASAPRSGSTLLDRLIGAQDGFCSGGELRFVWERSFGENQLCGCGAPFHECRFWLSVSRCAFGVAPRLLEGAATVQLQASLEHRRCVPWLLAEHRPAAFAAKLSAFGEVLEHLYGAILAVSEERVIVDSSKDPRYGLILARTGRFQVHVVHLTRDPRAVAFSSRRLRRRPEIAWREEAMPIEGPWACAARWSAHNALMGLLASRAASYCRVSYEQLVANPGGVLSSVLARHGSADVELRDMAGVELAPAHTVSGNPMRFASGPLEIRLDDEWREAMRRRDRLSVAAATWPLMARYGYRLRGVQ
ncbi:MAG TPA: sulfotransferase [Solirubrobacteraceae bacterium]|nr:sulfotransferase [Solirubrobacteraceae bacterium]